MTQCDEIRARWEGVGPWKTDLDVYDSQRLFIEAGVFDDGLKMLATIQTPHRSCEPDGWKKAKGSEELKQANLLANAPTDIAALLAEVERLRGALHTIAFQYDDCACQTDPDHQCPIHFAQAILAHELEKAG